jgi:hypothetical protein
MVTVLFGVLQPSPCLQKLEVKVDQVREENGIML